jgi:hypothetical protein
MLRAKKESVIPAAGMYYQVQDADNCQTKFILTNKKSEVDLAAITTTTKSKTKDDQQQKDLSFDEIIDISLGHISRYADSISSGNFQHTSKPKDYKCTSYCAFKRICRKDTGKLLALQE